MKKIGSSPLGTALLLLTALVWGMAFTVQKTVGDAIGSFTTVALRSFMAGVALIPVVFLFDKINRRPVRLFSRKELLGGVLCGVALGAGSVLQQLGIAANGNAGKTAFITSLYIVFVPLLGLLYGRKTPFRVLLGVFGAVAGAFVLAFDITGGTALGFSLGDLLVFACALVFAVQIIVIDRCAEGTDGVRMACVQFFACGLVCLPFSLLLEPESYGVAALSAALPGLLYLGLFSSGVGYTLQIVAQKRVHPAVACSVLSLESVFGLLGGILFGEMPSGREWVGCSILFISVVYTQLVSNKEETV